MYVFVVCSKYYSLGRMANRLGEVLHASEFPPLFNQSQSRKDSHVAYVFFLPLQPHASFDQFGRPLFFRSSCHCSARDQSLSAGMFQSITTGCCTSLVYVSVRLQMYMLAGITSSLGSVLYQRLVPRSNLPGMVNGPVFLCFEV